MNEDADNSNQLQSNPKIVEEKIKKFLDEKWKSDGCQICGEREFFPFDSVMKITEFSPKAGFVSARQSIPVVPVMCLNCGNINLFNAILAEVIAPQEPLQGEVK
jgi:RNase P subunit RPR2